MACRVEATRLRDSSLPFLEMSPARDEKAAATSAQVADAVYDELLSQVPGRPPKARHVLCPTLLLVVRPPLLLVENHRSRARMVRFNGRLYVKGCLGGGSAGLTETARIHVTTI